MTKLIKNFLQKLRRQNAYRNTYNQLQRLTDRELADIGIARGDIRNVAKGDPEYRLVSDYNLNLKGWV